MGDRTLPEVGPNPLGQRVPAGWLLGRWRWLVPVTAASATAAWVLGALSGRTHGQLRVELIVAGAALTALAVTLPLLQHRRASDARAHAVAAVQAARAAMRIALQDALDPFVHLVTRLAEAKAVDKPRLRGEAIQLAVTTLAALAGAERVRVCYFVLDPGPPRTVRLERFAGRAGAPTAVFTEGTGTGDTVLRVLERKNWIFVNDTAVDRPRFWWDVDPAYRTVLAGPVATPTTVCGLLTLDALAPGELSQLDLALVKLVSGLLAAALSL